MAVFGVFGFELRGGQAGSEGGGVVGDEVGEIDGGRRFGECWT